MTSKVTRENAAANAVIEHLTTMTGIAMTGRTWDDGAADRMHDFYIESDSQKIALEVTTIADGTRVGRDHRWEQMAPGGWVHVDTLSGCWIVYGEHDAEASSAIAAIRSRLPELEALGITEVDTQRWQLHAFSPEASRPPGFDQLRALHHVGVTRAGRVTDPSAQLLSRHAGQAQVVRGFGASRAADRNLPVTLVNQELREGHRSDVEKLIAVEDATARHLWMWVELTEGFAIIRSFDAEGLPNIDLDVEGIDAVWLARSPGPDIVAGHLWLRGQGWSEFSAIRNEASV